LGLLKACTFGAGKDISYRGVVFETGCAWGEQSKPGLQHSASSSPRTSFYSQHTAYFKGCTAQRLQRCLVRIDPPRSETWRLGHHWPCVTASPRI